MPRGRKSLLQLCIEQTGSNLTGGRMAAFVVAWGLARRELGEGMTVEQYASWWKQPRRSAFQEQSEFRRYFAPLQTPDPILDHMEAAGLGESVDERAMGLAS
jgi:hypothetical protein